MKSLFEKYRLILLLTSYITFGQNSNIDIQSYTNSIIVNDTSDVIIGETDINILFKEPMTSFSVDLINKNAEGKGMTVTKVLKNENKVSFTQSNNKLAINDTISATGQKSTYNIYYSGIPADGLIISKNKYGDRTFFGDNWPNRAKNWFPCIDHPSDKALVTFKITAPSYYQVIANGKLIEETNLTNGNTYYVWKTNVALPTKVMTIGIARFAVDYLESVHNIPISSWVYPQNKTEGFYDYAQAKQILNYFIENIGPYPYQKLSNVQSKTRYGGMENASNIFYSESSVSGKRDHEDLLAHEIAHQWFGDSATETDWSHLWLSEGFATYFTDLYVLHTHGNDAFKKRMISEKLKVLSFAKRKYAPIVDHETKNFMDLLNANSYQKGGWVLHMLRKKVGDDLFWESIRKYYDTYKLSNASTSDLQHVFETVTKQDLISFFKQWLFTAGHPELAFTHTEKDGKLNLTVSQKQKSDFNFVFPLEIKIIYNDNSQEIKTLNVSKRNETFQVPLKSNLKDIIIDPNTWLLFEDVTEK